MKAISLLHLLFVLTCAAFAEEQDIARHPDSEFRKALEKLEEGYINGMRALAEKSVAVRIYQIDSDPSEIDPFGTYPEDRFLVFPTPDEGCVYQVRMSSDLEGDREKIKAWAHAVLPPGNHAFAMCMPTPGFAIKFLDDKGATIYQTTICLKCNSAAMEFPRYSDRIGLDVDLIKGLLKDQGFHPQEGNAEQVAPSDGDKP
jgi:hypothetical protein